MTAPAWLDALQAEFSRFLRTPLASSSGTFCSQPDAYPRSLLQALAAGGRDAVSPEVQLTLYHEQYWMRLFTTLQGRFPRLAWAMGYWHFNQLAALHLAAHPPRHFDIDGCGEDFAASISDALLHWVTGEAADAWGHHLTQCRAPADQLRQALTIDAAERRVCLAPKGSVWTPKANEMASLSDSRLRFAKGFALVAEDWQLVACSSLAGTAAPPNTGQPPPRHLQTHYWVVYRTATGVTTQRVAKPFARLLTLCENEPFGAALSCLESELNGEQLASVRQHLPIWTHLALTLGWWTGVEA